MRASVIVSGVLGLGTAATFGAALVVATLFPNGATVAGSNPWGGGGVMFSNGGGGFVTGPLMVGKDGQVITSGGSSTTIGVAAPARHAVTAPDDGSVPTPAESTAP